MADALQCPICKSPVAPRAQNRAFPFCSERCRLVDLGKWLGEEYRVASDSSDERDDELPSFEADHDEDA